MSDTTSESRYPPKVYSVNDFGFEQLITINNNQEVKRCKSNNTATTQHIIIGSAPFIDEQFYEGFKTQDY